jgi:hypothetical protein
MLEHVPETLALAVAGVLVMVLVVLAVTEGWERRRSTRRKPDPSADDEP